VHRHARHQLFARLLRDKVAAPLRIADVENGDDVDLVAGRDEVYADRIGLALDLLGLEIRKRRLELLCQPVDQVGDLVRSESEET